MSRQPLHLFEAIGVEVEYMIVDRETLAVRPISDALIHAEVGAYESEIERGEIAWSNELALHVIELKTNGPRGSLDGLESLMQSEVRYINEKLASLGAQLMPGGMHPWMDPFGETKLWTHEYSPVYEAFHRIFDCRGHGWSNVQSVHLNLPFADAEEFGRLHAAIRFALPLLPALAASSPVADGRITGSLDTRLEHYRRNAQRVPSVSGRVIPEPVFTPEEYQKDLLRGIYDDLEGLDPEGILRHEWVNARGCIARFDRGAIEIRVLDVTECPRSDVAIARAIVALVRALANGEWTSAREQRSHSTDDLVRTFLDVVRDGDRALVVDERYARALGHRGALPCRANELWQSVLEIDAVRRGMDEDAREVLSLVLDRGPLARRILDRLGSAPSRDAIAEVYRELCTCLADGKLFRGAPAAPRP